MKKIVLAIMAITIVVLGASIAQAERLIQNNTPAIAAPVAVQPEISAKQYKALMEKVKVLEKGQKTLKKNQDTFKENIESVKGIADGAAAEAKGAKIVADSAAAEAKGAKIVANDATIVAKKADKKADTAIAKAEFAEEVSWGATVATAVLAIIVVFVCLFRNRKKQATPALNPRG